MLLVWLAEAVVFVLIVAGILAERPPALAATGAASTAAHAGQPALTVRRPTV